MSKFGSFLIRRICWIIVTLWIVYTLSFILMRSVPGGPFDSERKLPKDIQKNIEAKYNLDQPILVQYFDHLGGVVFHADFGPSFKMADFTVNEVIAQGFRCLRPWESLH